MYTVQVTTFRQTWNRRSLLKTWPHTCASATPPSSPPQFLPFLSGTNSLIQCWQWKHSRSRDKGRFLVKHYSHRHRFLLDLANSSCLTLVVTLLVTSSNPQTTLTPRNSGLQRIKTGKLTNLSHASVNKNVLPSISKQNRNSKLITLRPDQASHYPVQSLVPTCHPYPLFVFLPIKKD